jgi:hypothetical protein
MPNAQVHDFSPFIFGCAGLLPDMVRSEGRREDERERGREESLPGIALSFNSSSYRNCAAGPGAACSVLNERVALVSVVQILT